LGLSIKYAQSVSVWEAAAPSFKEKHDQPANANQAQQEREARFATLVVRSGDAEAVCVRSGLLARRLDQLREQDLLWEEAFNHACKEKHISHTQICVSVWRFVRPMMTPSTATFLSSLI
jgi:hypothetical protein